MKQSNMQKRKKTCAQCIKCLRSLGIWSHSTWYFMIYIYIHHKYTMPVIISPSAPIVTFCADVSLRHPLAELAMRKLLLWSPPSHPISMWPSWLETKQGGLVCYLQYLQKNDANTVGFSAVETFLRACQLFFHQIIHQISCSGVPSVLEKTHPKR